MTPPKLGKIGLEGLEGSSQKSPACHIGGTDERALHHCCVTQVLDNFGGYEYLAGRVQIAVIVTIHVDGSISIRDNGRGIPVDVHPEYKIPGVELVLTTLHSGGKNAGRVVYTYSGGTHGVGAKCVNAVSENGSRSKCRATAKFIYMQFGRAMNGKENSKSSANPKGPARWSPLNQTRKSSGIQPNSSPKANHPAFARTGVSEFRSRNYFSNTTDACPRRRAKHFYYQGRHPGRLPSSAEQKVKPGLASGNDFVHRSAAYMNFNQVGQKADIIADIVMQYLMTATTRGLRTIRTRFRNPDGSTHSGRFFVRL